MKSVIKFIFVSLILYSFPSHAQWSTSANNWSNGKLALGTSSNLNTLYVYSSNSQNLLKVENSRNSDAGIEFKSSLANFKIGSGIGIGSNAFTIYDLNATQIRMLINSSGNFGIGTSFPNNNYKLTVNGSILASGSTVAGYIGSFNIIYGTLYGPSDRKLKKDIEVDFSNHQNLYGIKTYSYKYKDDETNRNQFGVMAQEIKEIFPELVAERGEEGLAVNYVGMIPLMIRAIQDQKQTIDALQSELSDIKSAITGNPELAELLDMKGEYINVYPNPANQLTKVDILKSYEPGSRVELVNLNGEVVKTFALSNERNVDLKGTGLNNGIYFVRYYNGEELKQTKRIIIEQ